DHRIDVLRLVMGRTQVEEYEALGKKLFESFRLPLMKVRIIVTTKEYLLSAIEPLPFGELTEDDRLQLEGMGTWRG
ncbi:MAG TPA: RimK-like ATPgrasp N-terminal domain-containing protein, partial [Trueperaceae bacterium]